MASSTNEPNDQEEDLTPPAKRARTDDGPTYAIFGGKDGQLTKTGFSTHGQPVIDENLYSRQLYVLGRDAMVRMAQADVLICGLGGLGVEIAKNVILAGVRSVTLHDQAPCTLDDLSSQYYLSEDSLGDNRAEASEASLAELNEYVRVSAHTEPLTEDFVKQFSVLVLTQTPLESQEELAEFAHRNNIAVVVADTRGLAGQIFCDFGEAFRVLDTNGEPPQSTTIGSISKAEEGVVTCLDQMRHDFEDGDFVTFSEVKGMKEINDSPPMKIKVLSPQSFSVGDTTQFGDYEIGGVATQVKMPKDICFKSLQQSITEPEFVISDFAKMDRPAQLHLGFLALHAFYKLHSRLPYPWNKEDAAEVVHLAKEKNASMATPVQEADEKLIALLSCVSAGSLCPMQAVIGSIAAQEVVKACSGKFTPIRQWLYFDAFECLPPSGEVSPEAAKEMERTRYGAQVCVFGPEVQKELAAQTYFVVGAGAIGCELLKNFAMMGVGVDDGCVHVTDMDVIERSNLNRQFLFRPGDVGLMKSITAKNAVEKMNSEINIEAYEDRVGPETEDVYDDDFFESLNGVANALDNIDARQYMDRKCVYYRKPLLESGTTGTKGNVQVVVPHMTESYSSSHDPPEKTIPVCTIRHFPNRIEHTVEWARDEFEGLFKQSAENAVQYLTDPEYQNKILSQPQNQAVVALEGVEKILVTERCVVFDDCVEWARLRFEDQFNTEIRRLLRTYPADHISTSGSPFWSGDKRCPHPIQFDPDNTLHMDYIVAAANLRAAMFAIPPCVDRAAIAAMLEDIDVPATDLQPKVPEPIDDAKRLSELQRDLPSPEKLSDVTLTTLEFDKDDDTNFHMDFITAASNLRATNYDIALADKLKSKLIAGKIIPAIATTTSLVAGLACLELYKLAQRHDKVELYKNGFVNLALPFFGFSEPIAPAKKKYRDSEYTLWDYLEVQGEMTLQDFIDHFTDDYGVHVYMVAEGVRVLYADYMPPSYYRNRFNMTMSQVLETVSGKTIPPNKRALTFQLTCFDSNGQSVELPDVRYVLPIR